MGGWGIVGRLRGVWAGNRTGARSTVGGVGWSDGRAGVFVVMPGRARGGSVVGLVMGALLVGSAGAAGAVVSVSPGPPMPSRQWGQLCYTAASALPRLTGAGSSRWGTRVAQYALRSLGYRVGTIDGAYDRQTRKVVRRYQARVGVTVDGLTGPVTWGELQADVCGR